MKEKIEKTDFNEMSLESANEFLNELLKTEGEELKENVIAFIDALDYSKIQDKTLNSNLDVIFNDEKIKNVLVEMREQAGVEE
jgi:uncharacterized protein YaaW (UPF0174 family)